MQHLSELFAQATEYCQQFVDLLDQEKQALLDQDMPALQTLVRQNSFDRVVECVGAGDRAAASNWANRAIPVR